MRSLSCLMAIWVGGACGRVDFDERGVGDAHDDGDIDAQPCNEPWSTPIRIDVGRVGVSDPSVTADGLELFMSIADQIWMSTRTNVDEPWPPAVPLAEPPNTPDVDNGSAIRDDGLELYFTRTMQGNARVQRSRRATRTSPWDVAVGLSPVGAVDVTPDTLTMFAQDLGTGIRKYTRAPAEDDFTTLDTLGEPVNVAGAASISPSIASDGLDLYFNSDRRGMVEIWVAHRRAADSEFMTAGPTGVMGEAADISPDGRHLYFSAFDGGDRVLYEVTRCL